MTSLDGGGEAEHRQFAETSSLVKPTALLDRPVDDATRRQFLAGAAAFALLAGCGTEPQQAGTPAAARTIEHKFGSTEVPGSPQRVVTVGLTEQDYVLAFGIAPVGVREWFGVNSGLTPQEHDTLSGIAPTVAQPRGYADYGAPWQEITRVVGQALGRARQAEDLIAPIERRFQQVRAEQPEFAASTAVLGASIDGGLYAYAEGPAPRFLTSLGLRLPGPVAELFTGDDRAPVQLSLERLAVLDAADVLVLGVYGSRETSVATNPVYQQLDLATRGRDIRLPELSVANGVLSFGSVLSLPIALDAMVPRLATALDGDPQTKVEPVRPVG